MIWLAFLAVGMFCVSVGFVIGTAYGVSMEDRRTRDRQAMLRSLKQMEDRRAV